MLSKHAAYSHYIYGVCNYHFKATLEWFFPKLNPGVQVFSNRFQMQVGPWKWRWWLRKTRSPWPCCSLKNASFWTMVLRNKFLCGKVRDAISMVAVCQIWCSFPRRWKKTSWLYRKTSLLRNCKSLTWCSWWSTVWNSSARVRELRKTFEYQKYKLLNILSITVTVNAFKMPGNFAILP